MMGGRLSAAGGTVRLKWVVLGWLAAELVAFFILVRVLGLGGTIMLGLATTVLGLVMARRVGTSALFGLRGALDGRPLPEGAMAEGMLGGLGALLLILPGFVANFAGLALAAPSIRRKVLDVVGGAGGTGHDRLRKSGPQVLDLGPSDWRAID